MTSPDDPGLDRANQDELFADWVLAQGVADQEAADILLRGGSTTDHDLRAATAENDHRVLTTGRETLDAALDAEPKLFADHGTDPIALLPVRIETIWFTVDGEYPSASGHPPTLRVRVYPDDISLAHLDTTLTTTEAAAGAAYWQAPGPEPWQHIQQQLRSDRAAWAVQATRPGAPPAVVRDDATDRPQGTVAMPAQWRFVAFTDGKVVADQNGRPIPDPLPIDLLQTDTSWAISWRSALKAGMAIELSLPEGVDRVDQLFVVGLRPDSAAAGSARLGDLLDGHAFSAGLAFLPAGTPTNNTPGAHSGWSSAPTLPDPTDQRAPGQRPRADALAAALGLTGSEVLARCAGADDTEPEAVAALTMLSWPALGAGFAEQASSHVQVTRDGSGGHVAAGGDPTPWQRIRDHLLDHVRSRGPLPMLRIGSQPYGVLPVSSLDDWQPGPGADRDLLDWLKIGRVFWRGAAAGAVPAIGAINQNRTPEAMMVDLLTRAPTATGLTVTRMRGPTDTIAAQLAGGTPSPLTFPGPTADSALWWATAASVTPPLGTPDLIADLTAGHTTFTATVLATADYFHTVSAFLTTPSADTARAYDTAWPCDRGDGNPTPRRATLIDTVGTPDGLDVLSALTCLRNWSSLEAGQDALTNAFLVVSDVDQIVIDILDTHADRSAAIAQAGRWTTTVIAIETALRAVAAIPLPRICDLLAEVIDVYTHRLDAWITSLAASRLAELRAANPTGIRIGGYGWVENLAPMAERATKSLGPGMLPAIVSQQDGYLHAPSLQQATSAAVLRSGALNYPGQDTYSINLNSGRARTARWLLDGVRQGQTLGALLGYRFERRLHDAHLDTEIEVFRRKYPPPTVVDGDPGPPGVEAVAARNVVDGLKIAHDPNAATVALDPAAVGPFVDDLSDALDAVSDLLLAESVHHLVGGNPLRAGLSADMLGRGTDVPDTFEVLTTPHRARALTHRLAAVLPAAPPNPGWPVDDLARLAPELEAWIAHLLGPAAGWALTGKADGAAPTTVTLDRLGLGALSTVLDAASAANTALRAAAASGDAVDFSGPAWNGLQGMAIRIRGLLANAQPLLPAHLPDQPTVNPDLSSVQRRLTTYAALPGVAAHPGGADLAAAAAAPTTDPTGWLSTAATALSRVVGADIPLLPTVTTAAPTAHSAAPAADVDEWLLRYVQLRPVARSFYDTLLLGGLRGRRCETLHAAQDLPLTDPSSPPPTPEAWVGATYGAGNRPRAASHLVWHQPLPIGNALTGMVFDEWAERLPGADQIRQVAPGVPPLTSPPESELTGVAFHYDRPDAKAPQAVLLAVPPNLQRGWTPNTLVQVLRETMELGKLRGADLPDLNSLAQLLPAIRIPAVDNTASTVLKSLPGAPDGAADSPFRLEATHRTPDDVETGLTARVHDPLWLFTRQWQFGEFAAQDAGSPAWVRFSGTSQRLNAWRPAGATNWTPYDPLVAPLDPMIEAEPAPTDPDQRHEAEAGAHFRVMYAQERALGDQPFQLAGMGMAIDDPDASTVGLIGAVGGDVPDPQRIQLSIGSGQFEQSGLGDLGFAWAQWYDRTHSDHAPDCLDPTRFEHAVELSVGGTVLHAEGYLGDGFDWYHLDVDPTAAGAAADPPYTFTDEALPSVVRYGGLPADRFWEMEDARIDLGATDASTIDTGRLLLISFATVYGNDWFLAPLEVPVGSLTTLDHMAVHDVFDRTHLIDRAGRDDPTWSIYTVASPDPDHPAATGLLILPTTSGAVGEPLEQINLARDELANLAWAIQHRITDTRGESIDCRGLWLQRRPPPESPGPLPSYRVQTKVPDYWFPLVPVIDSPGVIHFTAARLELPDATTPFPRGRLVGAMSWLREEEIPREGAALARRPVLARWFDGSWYSWIRRQKSSGTGGSSSGLQFDNVWPTDPWPT